MSSSRVKGLNQYIPYIEGHPVIIPIYAKVYQVVSSPQVVRLKFCVRFVLTIHAVVVFSSRLHLIGKVIPLQARCGP